VQIQLLLKKDEINPMDIQWFFTARKYLHKKRMFKKVSLKNNIFEKKVSFEKSIF